MVVLSQPAPVSDHQLSILEPWQLPPITTKNLEIEIPVIDLSSPDSKWELVRACEEFGFFKVTGHGVSSELVARLEDEAVKFFGLPLREKEKAGSRSPFGYGNKRIGLNGDVGWLEYLLLPSSPESVVPDNAHDFRCAVKSYLRATKNLACRVLELVEQGLKMGQNDAFSRLLKDEKSDCYFRLNNYPPCPSELEALSGGGKVVGFGQHTDPQIISVLRSNDASGFQISVGDQGDWVSVTPDHSSFFVIVGDCFQVMTNGRFKSVKHRVLAPEGKRSRLSMIFFGGPPMSERIAPLPCLMKEGEESLYKEFTWLEYKKAAYKLRLADYRLGPFEKKTSALTRASARLPNN